MLVVWLLTNGSGLTVTVIVNGCPGHKLLDIGVTVYVMVTGRFVRLLYESVMFALDATVRAAPAGTLI